MAFVFVDLLSPGRVDGLNVYQVAGFTDKVPFVGGTVLDDHDPFEVDPEIRNPFLHSFFNAGIKAFHPDLEAAAILVGAFELLLGWLNSSLGHVETVHEFPGHKLDVIRDRNAVSIPLRITSQMQKGFTQRIEINYSM